MMEKKYPDYFSGTPQWIDSIEGTVLYLVMKRPSGFVSGSPVAYVKQAGEGFKAYLMTGISAINRPILIGTYGSKQEGKKAIETMFKVEE